MHVAKTISNSILVKNSVYNLIGMALPLVVGVLSVPYAISGLGKDLFGILTLIWVILGFLSLLDFGLARATTKFIAESIKNNQRSEIPSLFWTSIYFNLILGAAAAVIFYFLCPVLIEKVLNVDNNFQNTSIESFRLLAFFLPILLVSLCLKGILGAAQRFDLVNMVHIPVNMSGFIIPALAHFFPMDLYQIVLYILIFRFIGGMAYFILCFKIYPECKSSYSFQKETSKKLFVFGGWVSITGFISPLLVSIDRFFIGSMLNMQSLTFYSAPLEALQRLRIFPQSIMNTLFPEFSQGLGRTTEKRLQSLYWKAFKFIFMISGYICGIVFVFSSDILRIWLGQEFVVNSSALVHIFSLGIIFNFLAQVPFTYLQGIGRPDIPAKYHLMETPVYLIVLYLFITKIGLLGAVIAWCLRVIVDFFLLFYKSMELLPGKYIPESEKPYLQRLGLALIIAVVIFLIVQLKVHSIVFKSINIVLVTIIFMVTSYQYIIAPEEKVLFRRFTLKNSNG